jgi:hypothetical protein
MNTNNDGSASGFNASIIYKNVIKNDKLSKDDKLLVNRVSFLNQVVVFLFNLILDFLFK